MVLNIFIHEFFKLFQIINMQPFPISGISKSNTTNIFGFWGMLLISPI